MPVRKQDTMALEIDRLGSERADQPMGLVARFNVIEAYDSLGWVLDPPFQRGSVWTVGQKKAWIESILMGVCLPDVFVNRFPEEHPVYGWREIVIDGQQRIRATAEFMRDEFSVRGELYSQQSESFRRSFIMAGGICTVIYCSYETDKECAELYLKLLQAGTAHTPAEIKKAVDFIEDCA